MAKKFIVDCDPGLDDGRALVFLLSAKDADIVCITVGVGNVSVPKMVRNVAVTTFALDKAEIPIYSGALVNYAGETVGNDFFYGPDGFGCLKLKHDPNSHKTDMTGPEAILHYGKKFPQEITLICSGPLNNLAHAFDKDPSITSLFKEIWIMGGNREEKTLYNVSQWSEFNFYSDPYAAEIVMKNFGHNGMTPVTLIDWWLCLKYKSRIQLYKNIAAELSKQGKNGAGQIIGKLPPGVQRDICLGLSKDHMVTADELNTLLCYQPSLILKSHKVQVVSIDTTKEKRGHSIFNDDENGNITLIDEVDAEGLENLYESVIVGK